MNTRAARGQRDQGFTLIELLVVVIIVGILAAIAIPVFLNQRKKAVDASLKADLKNAALIAEDILADPPVPLHANLFLPSGGNVIADVFHAKGHTFTEGNTIRAFGSPANRTFQLCAFNPGASTATDASHAMLYDNTTGGPQTAPVDCTGGNPGGGWHNPWYGVSISEYPTFRPLETS